MFGRRTLPLLCLLTLRLGGAEADPSYVFERAATEPELANANVVDALQTRDGYLWLATGGGLARFDGVHFTSFRPANTAAFETALVTSLCEDRDGDLWIGTGSGVVRRHLGAFTLIGLRDATVSAITQDASGRIWIGTHERGIFFWENGRLEPLDAPLPVSYVVSLHADQTGRLWIGFSDSELGCWNRGRLKLVFGAGELGDRVESIGENPAGVLWFGTHSHGLFRLRGGVLSRIGPEQGMTLTEVSDVHAARDGSLWVAGGSIERADNPDLPRFRKLANVPTGNVLRLAEDREGGIWLCAHEDGLFRSRPYPYRSIAIENGLPDNSVRTVTEDRAGHLWLALQRHGIARVSPTGVVRLYGSKDGLPDDNPASAYAASDGTVWIGGDGELCAWRNGALTRFADVRAARAMYEDRRGAIWFGTDESGLYRYADGVFTHGGAPGTLNHATSFAEGRDGALYVGRWDGGLASIKEGTVRTWNHAQGLPADEVRAVCVDREGNLWVGFRTRGLALFKDDRWWNPDPLSEEVANHVSAIVDDDQGRLWLGTGAGIVWAWKSDLLAAAQGAALPTMHFTGLGEGPRPVQVWSGAQPTAWRTREGRIAFATRQGVFIVDPQEMAVNALAPPVVIERATVDRSAWPAAKAIDLPAGARQLSIDYSAPSFVQPSRVLFKYQLEGYDEGRISAGTARTATYGELPPGRYTFRVTACNNDGVWNKTGVSLAVVQEPHFYQTRSFYAAAAAVAGGLALLLYRWSNRRLRLKLEMLEQKHAMDRERQRIAKILHDDLGADLTEIGLVAEAARQSASLPQALDEVAVLSERVRGVAGSLDTIVWAVNPANDSLDNLAGYLCDYFQGLFRRTSIRSRVEMADEPPAHPLTPEERSNLFLSAKEAMINVVRHSGATEVRLRIRMDGDRFHLDLEDNGGGFDPDALKHAKRNGLANMRSRLAELGGSFTLVSTPGGGTTVMLAVPFPSMPIRLAIVEDNAAVSASLARVIGGSADCVCIGACATGREALRCIPAWKPDIAIMDIELPDISGIECTAQLKRGMRDLQILILTVYNDNRQIFRALEAGASGYLLKRSSPQEILHAIRDVREGGSPMTAEIARKVVQSFRRPAPRAETREILTDRETEILGFLAKGFASKEIADQLGISHRTVCGHLGNIYAKLHVRSRTEAVVKCFGLSEPAPGPLPGRNSGASSLSGGAEILGALQLPPGVPRS